MANIDKKEENKQLKKQLQCSLYLSYLSLGV